MWRSSRHTWVPRTAACRLHNDKQIPRNHICDINLLRRYFGDVPCSIRCEQGRLCQKVEKKQNWGFTAISSDKMLFLNVLHSLLVSEERRAFTCAATGNPCMWSLNSATYGHKTSRGWAVGFATVRGNLWNFNFHEREYLSTKSDCNRIGLSSV